jgi:trigger factor
VIDANVTSTLETVRRQRAKYNRVERAAANGDLVNVDFEGLIAGQPSRATRRRTSPSSSARRRCCRRSRRRSSAMKAGETKTFPLVFPQDYNEQLRGKTADFTVTVNQVAEPELPAVDADFRARARRAGWDVERLRSEVRENITKEVAKRIKATLKEQVMQALLETATFEVPRALLDAGDRGHAESRGGGPQVARHDDSGFDAAGRSIRGARHPPPQALPAGDRARAPQWTAGEAPSRCAR